MKKHLFKTMMMGLTLMFAPSVMAQNGLGDVLSGVLGAATSSQGDDLLSNLTSVFSSNKQATAQKIVGTWSYSEPAIVFTSDNILAKAASKVAANKLEAQLQTQLSRYGIKPGAYSMTFKEDGTFTETLGGKLTQGTWAIKDNKLQLTVAGIKTLSLTTQIDGKDLQIVTDATKLLTLFKTIGANSSSANLKTATTLLKSVKGMQAGITLRKQ